MIGSYRRRSIRQELQETMQKIQYSVLAERGRSTNGATAGGVCLELCVRHTTIIRPAMHIVLAKQDVVLAKQDDYTPFSKT